MKRDRGPCRKQFRRSRTVHRRRLRKRRPPAFCGSSRRFPCSSPRSSSINLIWSAATLTPGPVLDLHTLMDNVSRRHGAFPPAPRPRLTRRASPGEGSGVLCVDASVHMGGANCAVERTHFGSDGVETKHATSCTENPPHPPSTAGSRLLPFTPPPPAAGKGSRRRSTTCTLWRRWGSICGSVATRSVTSPRPPSSSAWS